MNNFGFAINVGRQIDFDKNDKSLFEFIKTHEPSIKLCIGCGACTATCTSGNLTQFNFRKLHMLLSRGEDLNVEKEILKCMLCGKCKLVCPRGVNTRNVIFLIKRWILEKKSELVSVEN